MLLGCLFCFLKNSIRHNLSLHDMFVRESTPDGKISYWTIKPEANRCLTLDQVYKVSSISLGISSTTFFFFSSQFSSRMWPRLLFSPDPALQPVTDPAAPSYPQTMQVSYQQVRLIDWLIGWFLLKLPSVRTSSHCIQTDRADTRGSSSPSPRDHRTYLFIPGFDLGGSGGKHDRVCAMLCVAVWLVSLASCDALERKTACMYMAYGVGKLIRFVSLQQQKRVVPENKKATACTTGRWTCNM